MSIFRSDTVGSWTRGGQAIVHNVRMTMQVFFQTLLAGGALWLIGTVWYVLENSSDDQRFVLTNLVEAKVKASATPGVVQPVLFRMPAGRSYWTSADALLASGMAKDSLHELEKDAVEGMAISGVIALLAIMAAWWSFTRTGKGLGSSEYLRGAHFGNRREMRRLLRRHAKGSFAIGSTDVPAAFETEHILLCGAPGAGKTNIIVKMLAGIRQQGRRAIVYDTAGTFVQKFYRPGRDILLNPFDERSAVWSPWVDVPEECHYDQIAASIVLDKSGDPFWATSARGTLVAAMRKLKTQRQMTVSALLDVIARSPLKKLAAFLRDTEGAAFSTARKRGCCTRERPREMRHLSCRSPTARSRRTRHHPLRSSRVLRSALTAHSDRNWAERSSGGSRGGFRRLRGYFRWSSGRFQPIG